MNKLDKLTDKWNAAIDKADDAKSLVNEFVSPIINILYGNGSGRIYMYPIRRITHGSGNYRVETISDRDRDAWVDYIIPKDIINAKNPIAAATAHAQKVAKEKETSDQTCISAEIARLQSLLGEK